MNVNLDEWQKAVLGALVTFIAGLFGWRSFSRVKTDNAKEQRESRFEENLQKRYEAAMGRISELQDELQRERDGRALLMRRAREDARRIRNLLDMMEPEARRQAGRWVEESGFAPFESGSGRNKP